MVGEKLEKDAFPNIKKLRNLSRGGKVKVHINDDDNFAANYEKRLSRLPFLSSSKKTVNPISVSKERIGGIDNQTNSSQKLKISNKRNSYVPALNQVLRNIMFSQSPLNQNVDSIIKQLGSKSQMGNSGYGSKGTYQSTRNLQLSPSGMTQNQQSLNVLRDKWLMSPQNSSNIPSQFNPSEFDLLHQAPPRQTKTNLMILKQQIQNREASNASEVKIANVPSIGNMRNDVSKRSMVYNSELDAQFIN